MSTVDTSTWNPDPALNESIGDIPLNANASIQQTWQALRVLMAAVKGDGDAIKSMIDVMQGATISADGASGLVPKPLAGDQDKYLKGDGTWETASASSIDASAITSGTIDLARLPAGALERLVTVADQTARYALTAADVQLGDTVKQLDTGVMYIVVDASKLGQAAGYVEYTAGSAVSVPWSGVTDKPSTFTPSSHTHGSITNDGKLGTASRVVVTGGNKAIGVSSITTTKLGYLTDVTANIQGQIDGKTEESDLWNWQKTEKVGSVVFKPVPESDLEPVVDFLFTETPPASGDKGPENPSTMTGATAVEIGRCGKNLLVYPYIENSHTFSGSLTATVNSDGSVKYNGTGSGSGRLFFSVADGSYSGTTPCKIELAPGVQYTFSLKLVSGNVSDSSDIGLAIIDHDAGAYIGTCAIGASVTFTAANRHFRARLEARPNVSFSNVVVAPQLELGSAATLFEPYSGDEYTIQLGDTYYGGSLDVAIGVMTVTRAAVAPASATVDISSAPAALPLEYADTYGREITSADGTSLSVGSSGGTVVYKLAVPQTVQLTPAQIRSLPALDKYEPRVNTVYTDQQAVQIGYQRFFDEKRLATLEARIEALENANA